ncbi:MAG: hypothetical protein IJ224_07050, partial [Lachnospiraceae bacterium]|nr:hypothetical protein [Lachnospiraceae bacterium]
KSFCLAENPKLFQIRQNRSARIRLIFYEEVLRIFPFAKYKTFAKYKKRSSDILEASKQIQYSERGIRSKSNNKKP